MSGEDSADNGTGQSDDWHRMSNEDAVRLRLWNVELRRLLEKHQWSGITPTKSYGACPECGGSSAPFADGHRPGCAIAAALEAEA